MGYDNMLVHGRWIIREPLDPHVLAKGRHAASALGLSAAAPRGIGDIVYGIIGHQSRVLTHARCRKGAQNKLWHLLWFQRTSFRTMLQTALDLPPSISRLNSYSTYLCRSKHASSHRAKVVRHYKG